MIAALRYVEHWRDIRSKAKQKMRNKFFRFVDSTDLQTPTRSGMADQLATGSCRSKKNGINMRKKLTKERTVGSLHMEADELTVRGGKGITKFSFVLNYYSVGCGFFLHSLLICISKSYTIQILQYETHLNF